MTKKAVAYVSDIILGRTGEIISRQQQRERIEAHARENGIEIAAWFEDEMFNEDVLGRPGVAALLEAARGADMLLCERVWAFSRSMKALEPFFGRLDAAGVRLEAATCMWDCVSQMTRRRFNPALRSAAPRAVVRREETAPMRIARPARLNFANLVARPQES